MGSWMEVVCYRSVLELLSLLYKGMSFDQRYATAILQYRFVFVTCSTLLRHHLSSFLPQALSINQE